MRQICLRIIFNMYINDASISQGIKGHRTPFTYSHMVPILRFFTPIYTENYLLNFICQHKYTHTQEHVYHTSYYKYFHKTKHKY